MTKKRFDKKKIWQKSICRKISPKIKGCPKKYSPSKKVFAKKKILAKKKNLQEKRFPKNIVVPKFFTKEKKCCQIKFFAEKKICAEKCTNQKKFWCKKISQNTWLFFGRFVWLLVLFFSQTYSYLSHFKWDLYPVKIKLDYYEYITINYLHNY